MPEDAPEHLAVALVSCCHEGRHSTACHSVQGEGGLAEQEGDYLKETKCTLALLLLLIYYGCRTQGTGLVKKSIIYRQKVLQNILNIVILEVGRKYFVLNMNCRNYLKSFVTRNLLSGKYNFLGL